MSSDLDRYREDCRKLVEQRINLMTEDPAESTDDVMGSRELLGMATVLGRAVEQELAAAPAGEDWSKAMGAVVDFEAARSAINGRAMYEASLDRRGKILAGLNVASAIKADKGLIDIVTRAGG